MNRILIILGIAAVLVVAAFASVPLHPSTLGPEVTEVSATSEALLMKPRLVSPLLANGGASNYLAIELEAPAQGLRPRLPVNLAAVIDRSGSMSGEKLERAKQAAHYLVERLHPTDRLAIVHYGSDVVELESTAADEAGKARMRAFIDGIACEGGTNIGDGLTRGARVLQPWRSSFAVNRLILLSDGQPTDGITHADALATHVRSIREEGVTVTALGVGVDFNEVLMRRLSETGGGFYGYLRDAERLSEVFGRELDQATRLAARNVQLRIEVPAGVTVDEVIGWPSTRVGDEVRVDLHDFSEGLTARVMLRLKTTLPARRASQPVGAIALHFHDVAGERDAQARVMLSGRVTDDHVRSLEAADPILLADATRAEGARNLQLAAERMREGRRADALKLFDATTHLFRNAFGSTANALSGDVQALEEQRAAVERARGDEYRHELKSLHQKTMQNFGSNNAY